MKHKTSELTGALLDAAVAKAKGIKLVPHDPDVIVATSVDDVSALFYTPSRDWKVGGPIIEREQISVECEHPGCWFAQERYTKASARGESPLIAAMRAFVAAKIGPEVEL